MRIAYLLGSLNRGGTETLLLDVFRNAMQNKLDAIGVYRKGGVLEADFVQSGVPMHTLSYKSNLLVYLIKLRNLLIRNKITTVHAQQPIDALFARIACLGTGIKIILTFHGYDIADKRNGSTILKLIIRKTHANLFVSKCQCLYYQQKYALDPEKQQVVYNGISFDKLDTNLLKYKMIDCSQNGRLRNELNISTATLLFGSVGNFAPGRDQFTLCRFLKLLAEQRVDFHFIFVGGRVESSPALYDTCYNFCQQNDLANRVSFLGVRNDVPTILPQLDAFLYATDHDTFGIAVVEAMAVGVPVFVNDWEVMSEVIDGEKYATLYKTRDEVDLLQQIMLFLQHKAAYKAKANDAARFVREKYSIERHIEKLKKVYQQVGVNRS